MILTMAHLSVALAMTYFTIHTDVIPSQSNPNNENMAFSKIKGLCLESHCRHGFACQGEACWIVSNTWSGTLTPVANAKFYEKVKVSAILNDKSRTLIVDARPY